MNLGTAIDAYLLFAGGEDKPNLIPKEYFIGYQGETAQLQDVLNAFNLTLQVNELAVLSIALYVPSVRSYQIRKFLLKKPTGATYNPLGAYAEEKDLIEISTEYPNADTTQAAVTAVNAVLFPELEITHLEDLIARLNALVWNLTDASKIFYWKVITPTNEYVYVFAESAIRGMYGLGQARQFTAADLVKFYSNETGTIQQPAVQKNEMSEKVITSSTDVNNLDIQGYNNIGFTQAISITGIKKDNLYDGQRIIIKNNSDGLLFLKHLSSLSSPGNRIYVIGEIDLSLKPNTCAELVYSSLRNRLETINVFGTDYMATLVYGGMKNRAVMATPDGIVTAEEVAEFWKMNDTTVGFSNLAAIAAAYPSIDGNLKGLQVVTPFTTPPAIYWKAGDGDTIWLKHTNAGLVLMT